MKLATALLVGSLSLNMLLLGTWLLSSAPKVNTKTADALLQNSTSGARTPAANSLSPLGAQHLSSLEPAALRTELLRLNLPRAAVEALVIARIYAQHDARRHELILATNELPWWQTAGSGPDRKNLMTPEQRKELRHLDAAARSEAVRLLGPAALDRDGAITARYAFVPEERAVFLDSIVRDYQDIRAMVREDMHGLRTSVDRALEERVEAERLRDLRKLLPADELEIFELRTSPVTADALRSRSFVFEPSEQEYRALFAIYHDFHEKNPGSVTVEGENRPALFSEYPEYEQKIREILGESRYGDWNLAGRSYTQVLSGLAPEFGLSPAAVKASALLLRETAARSRTMGEEPATSVPQKQAALAALAAATRQAMVDRIGATAGAAVLSRTPWVDMIAAGNSVNVEGRGISWSPVDKSARPILPARPVPSSSAAPAVR